MIQDVATRYPPITNTRVPIKSFGVYTTFHSEKIINPKITVIKEFILNSGLSLLMGVLYCIIAEVTRPNETAHNYPQINAKR